MKISQIRHASHAAVCKVDYVSINDDDTVKTILKTFFSKKDGTVDLLEEKPYKEGYICTGWKNGNTELTKTTVLGEDVVAKPIYEEIPGYARMVLCKTLLAAAAENGQLQEESYTTASYSQYEKVWKKAYPEAESVRDKQSATAEELRKAEETFRTQYTAAKAGLVQADVTVHLLYGAVRQAAMR